jgi:glucan 1,3-beta-glucosidase
MLEKWMANSLFAQNAPNAVDDYTFAQALGDKTASVLNPYWESWVTNADIDAIAAAGVNMIRIPVGYWVSSSALRRL